MTTLDQRLATSDTARRAMIDSQLRTSGINEPWVLAAVAAVPREAYVPDEMKAAAYIDRAIALGGGRYLAAPVVHGRMLAEAAPTRADTALLVGDGDGYLAALLRPLVRALDAITPADACVPDPSGAPAPYTLIIVDGAAEHLPATLTNRLADGGRIVSGLVDRGVTRLAAGARIAGTVTMLPIADMGIPVLAALNAPKGWSF